MSKPPVPGGRQGIARGLDEAEARGGGSPLSPPPAAALLAPPPVTDAGVAAVPMLKRGAFRMVGVVLSGVSAANPVVVSAGDSIVDRVPASKRQPQLSLSFALFLSK